MGAMRGVDAEKPTRNGATSHDDGCAHIIAAKLTSDCAAIATLAPCRMTIQRRMQSYNESRHSIAIGTLGLSAVSENGQSKLGSSAVRSWSFGSVVPMPPESMSIWRHARFFSMFPPTEQAAPAGEFGCGLPTVDPRLASRRKIALIIRSLIERVCTLSHIAHQLPTLTALVEKP
jgi:hypothetical protein